MRLPRYISFAMTGIANSKLSAMTGGGLQTKKEQTEVCSLFVYKKVAFNLDTF